MAETSGERPPSLKDRFQNLFKGKPKNLVSEQLGVIKEGINNLSKLQKNSRPTETPEEENRRKEEETKAEMSDEEVYLEYRMAQTLTKKRQLSDKIRACTSLTDSRLRLAYYNLQSIYDNQYLNFELDYKHELNLRRQAILDRLDEALGIESKTKANIINTKRPNETSEERLKRILEEKKNKRSPIQIKMDETETQFNRDDITGEQRISLMREYAQLHQRDI